MRADSLEEIQVIIKKLFIEEPETAIALQQNALDISQPHVCTKNCRIYFFSRFSRSNANISALKNVFIGYMINSLV